MFDDDEISEYDLDTEGAVSLGLLQGALRARNEAEVLRANLPFDLKYVVSKNLMIYDCANIREGNRVGRWALFRGGEVITDTGERSVMPPTVGMVAFDFHGQIVLEIDTEDGDWVCLGWLDDADFELIDIHFPESQKWKH